MSALQSGIRYARYSRHLRATLLRAVGFILFASAYWALLPLLARERIVGGPSLYGVLLGVIGASAIAGAFTVAAAEEKAGSGSAGGRRSDRYCHRAAAVRRGAHFSRGDCRQRSGRRLLDRGRRRP